jgi:hypothetical protein
VRAEFFRDGDQQPVVGSAVWDGSKVTVQSQDEDIAAVLWRIFRPTAVAVDDAALRTAGTAGPIVLPPGTLGWFQAAARVRGPGEGLGVRFVPEGRHGIGWDPAGAYRPFGETVERRERRSSQASA